MKFRNPSCGDVQAKRGGARPFARASAHDARRGAEGPLARVKRVRFRPAQARADVLTVDAADGVRSLRSGTRLTWQGSNVTRISSSCRLPDGHGKTCCWSWGKPGTSKLPDSPPTRTVKPMPGDATAQDRRLPMEGDAPSSPWNGSHGAAVRTGIVPAPVLGRRRDAHAPLG